MASLGRTDRHVLNRPFHAAAAVLAGAALLAWPAFVNRYPIVFSDTGGFLEQALMPDGGWDKPWIYGPFLTPFHLGLSLWPAALAQCLILSAMLWMTQACLRAPSLRPPGPARHLVLCAVLAAASAAPWFAALLMPDIFAPITVLALFVLAQDGLGRWARIWVGLVATIAIASHLAHLVLAAGCLAALLVLYRRVPLRPATPLLAATLLLLATNWVAHGRLAISPYGAVFALARMVGDGPARTYIDAACPAANYRVCAWAGRLPEDSDAFLWDPHGPVWADGYGPIRIAPEAQEIVRATLRALPVPVLQAALRNTARQLTLVQVGDALVPDHLGPAVLERLRTYFPAAEAARFEASLQAAGTLPALAAPLVPIHEAALVIGGLLCAALAAFGWRRDTNLARLAALVLVGLLANAASTGALSGPHHRYQARIAWLVLVPPLLYSGRVSSAASRSRWKLRRLNGSIPA